MAMVGWWEHLWVVLHPTKCCIPKNPISQILNTPYRWVPICVLYVIVFLSLTQPWVLRFSEGCVCVCLIWTGKGILNLHSIPLNQYNPMIIISYNLIRIAWNILPIESRDKKYHSYGGILSESHKKLWDFIRIPSESHFLRHQTAPVLQKLRHQFSGT